MFQVASCTQTSPSLNWWGQSRPPSGPRWACSAHCSAWRGTPWRLCGTTWPLCQSYSAGIPLKLSSRPQVRLIVSLPLVKGCEVYLPAEASTTLSNSSSILCLLAFPMWTTPDRFGRVLMESRTCFSLIWVAGGGQATSWQQMLQMRSLSSWDRPSHSEWSATEWCLCWPPSCLTVSGWTGEQQLCSGLSSARYKCKG